MSESLSTVDVPFQEKEDKKFRDFWGIIVEYSRYTGQKFVIINFLSVTK